MMPENLYRMIAEEGKHPAKSRTHPGAISGVALDDKTNKLSGTLDFEPVTITYEDECPQTQTEYPPAVRLIEDVIYRACGAFECWYYEEALPWFTDEFVPAAKNKAVTYLKRKFRKTTEESQPSNLKDGNTLDVADVKNTPFVALPNIGAEHPDCAVIMSKEEAQQEMSEAVALRLLSEAKLQRLRHANIVDTDGHAITNEMIKELTEPDTSKKQKLLECPMMINESTITGISAKISNRSQIETVA